MPKRSPTTKKRQGIERLGPVFHRLRTERSLTTTSLSKETGLPQSYLSYLERGRFQDIGVEKFSRLIQALKVSADHVLAEAGYLATGPKGPKLLDPETYLRLQYKLTPAKLAMATSYLEFLARKDRRRPKAEAESKARR
ncbi:MAG: helix-turn-helix domain-containing protein [Chloroflexota bacterium]|nr:helix-turn-helix domain-containing protein [Chloroflexota bacterium]